MVDSTDDQDKHARDEEGHQRERKGTEPRKRSDETEPPHDQDDQLGDLDAALDDHDYPTTVDELVTAYGDREVESKRDWKSIEEVFAPIDNETYDSADEVRQRILRLLYRE
ncbi:DUF5789 family protein [Halocatena salina]